MAIDFATTSNMFTVGSTPNIIQTASNSIAYASGNPSFSAWHTTTQAQNTVLLFNSIVFNVGSAYNPATGVFTAPTAGVYHFRVQICIPNTVGDWRVYLVASGKQQRQTIFYQGITTLGVHTLSCEGIYNMSSGDTIYSLYTGPAGTNIFNGTSANHFTGYMVS